MDRGNLGLAGLLEEIPELRRPEGVAQLLLTALLPVTAAIVLTRWLDKRGPLGSLAGQAAAVAAGTSRAAMAFRRREEWQRRYGAGAYRHAFWWHLAPGIPLALTSVIHLLFIPGGLRPRWVLLPALYLAATGAALMAGAFKALGIDTVTLRYVYRPAAGPLITSGTLGFIRHPLYSAGSRIALAIGLLRGGFTALAAGAVVPLAFATLIRVVEEPELVARFGQAYERYRRQTPAFFVTSPGRLVPFWRQLVANVRQ